MPEELGLIASIDNAQFLAGAQAYVQSVQSMIAANNQIAQSSGILAGPMNTISAVAQSAKGGFDQLTVGALALGSTIGNLASSAIQSGVNALTSLGQTALDTVGNYEHLSASIESLVAEQFQASGSTHDINDALAQAAPIAEETLQWIDRLAIASPFGPEDVQSAYQMQIALGFTNDEAKTLTQSILNVAAVSPRGSAAIGSISEGLSVLANEGVLTTRRFRELARAGVPVNTVLADMNKSMADISKGTISATDFINSFVKVVDRDLSGAAERQTNTLQGLGESFKEIGTIGLREFFGPALQEIEPELGALVTDLRGALIPALKELGKGLAEGVKFILQHKTELAALVTGVGIAGAVFLGLATTIGVVAGAMALLSSPITGIALAFGALAIGIGTASAAVAFNIGGIQNTIAQFLGTTDITSYGENLIYSFAQGMANAIGAIIDVLNSIGDTISHWLAPGSPPNLLPDIDQWGTDAMNVYLQGWTKADFDILKDVATPIDAFLRSLPETIIPKTGIIPLILGSQSEIEKAISEMERFGSVSEASLQNIFKAIGQSTPEIQSYVHGMFSLESANRAVESAQKNLNDVQARYSAILAPLNAELEAIQNKRQDVIDQQRSAELQSIANNRRAPKQAKELALMELREIALKRQVRETTKAQSIDEQRANLALQTAQAQQSAAQAQVDAAKKQIELQTENNNLLKEQLALLAQQHGGGPGGGPVKKPSGGGGGAPSPFGGLKGLGGAGGLADDIDNKFSQMFENLKLKALEFAAKIVAPFTGLQDKFDSLVITYATVKGKIDKIVQDGTMLWNLWWTQHSLDVVRAILNIQNTGTNLYNTAVNTVTGILGAGKTIWDGLWNQHKDFVQNVNTTLWNYVIRTFTIDIDILGHLLSAGIALMAGDWTQFNADVQAIVNDLWTSTKDLFDTGISLIEFATLEYIDTWKQDLKDWSSSGQTIVNDAWKAIKQAFDDGISNAQNTLNQGVRDFQKAFNDVKWNDIGTNIMDGIGKGLTDSLQSLLEQAKDIAKDIYQTAMNALGAHSPSTLFRRGPGWAIPSGWAMGIRDNTHLITSAVKSLGRAALEASQGFSLGTSANVQGKTNATPAFTGRQSSPVFSGRLSQPATTVVTVPTGGQSQSANVNFYGTQVNKPMDLEILSTTIQRVQKRALSGA